MVFSVSMGIITILSHCNGSHGAHYFLSDSLRYVPTALADEASDRKLQVFAHEFWLSW